jgi:hypothetical protein
MILGIVIAIYIAGFLIIHFFKPVLVRHYMSEENFSLDAAQWPLIIIILVTLIWPLMFIETYIINPIVRAGERFFKE